VRLAFYDDTVLDGHFDIFAACNGILLVGFGEKDHYLWNPTTGSHKKLSSNFSHCRKELLRMYGLWFDSACNAFKAIRIFKMKSSSNCKFGKKTTDVRIYNSRTDSWKMIEDFHYEVVYEQQGRVWNGSPYWIVGSNDSRGVIVIYFHDDRFKEIDFPVSGDYDIGLLRHCKENRIKFAVSNGLLHLAVRKKAWTMKEVGGSWIEWKDTFYKLDFDVQQQRLNYVTYFETPISPHIASEESDE
jgi:F-box interacting protein